MIRPFRLVDPCHKLSMTLEHGLSIRVLLSCNCPHVQSQVHHHAHRLDSEHQVSVDRKVVHIVEAPVRAPRLMALPVVQIEQDKTEIGKAKNHD